MAEKKNKPQPRVEDKPSKTKPWEVKTESGKRVVIIPEQLEDHEKTSDRIWEMIQRRNR